MKKSVLAAKSVAYSAGASGNYVVGMFQKLGIADEVKSKTATVKPGELVGEVVARGDAEIGFQQVSELVPVKGIQYLGPLPAEIQNITVFSGALHSGTSVAEATTRTHPIPHRAGRCADHQEARPGAGLTVC